MGGSSKKAVTGYRYHMGLHMIWCAGPVDAVLELRSGDRTAWTGSITGSQQIAIDAPELFGGEAKEGGLVGPLDVMMGEVAQAANSYLAEQQDGAPQPAYRGLLGTVFRRGLIACNNPYIKPWAMKARRILKGWQSGAPAWYPAKAEITVSTGDKAANPAHVVYECLTNVEWGMGEPVGIINDASFRAAADRFHADGMGICMIWTRQTEIGEFIKQIVSQAGAIMSQNPSTGLFELTPIRDDYTVSSLPVLNPSNCIALESYERASPADITNELTVQYNDLATGKRGSVTVQNVANIQSQGGIVSTTRQYPGIPTSDLAVRVALRDLAAVSTPVARVKIRANRQAHKLMPGSVFRLDWPPLGISGLVLRVLAVNRGTLTNGQMVIEASEDVFSLPASGYAQQPPPGWTDPTRPPGASPYRLLREATYFELQRQLSSADLAALADDAAYLATAAARPSNDAVGYATLVRQASATTFPYDRTASSAPFAPHGTLSAELTQTATSATISAGDDLDLVTAPTWAQVDSEIIRIDSINVTTGAITIGRGVMDTVAARHAAGARVFFLGDFIVSDAVERVQGESLSIKLLPSTGRGELVESAAPADLVTMAGRQVRPYPPGRLRINGQPYPAAIVDEPITVSWAHRSRLQQNLEGDESGSIGPEPGTTYSLRVLSEAGAVVKSIDGLGGTTSWAAGAVPSGNYVIEAWSRRDGVGSLQRHQHPIVVSFSAEAAWNRRWGIKWGLPAPLPKIVEITLGGSVNVGAQVRITLAGVVFARTEVSGDTLASIAAALASSIDAHADYSVSAAGPVITITGPGRIDYSVSVSVLSAAASIGAAVVAREPASAVQAEQYLPMTGTPAEGQVLSLTINGSTYSHTVPAGQSLGAAAGALAAVADAAPGVSVVADTTRDEWRITPPLSSFVDTEAAISIARDLAPRRELWWYTPSTRATRLESSVDEIAPTGGDFVRRTVASESGRSAWMRIKNQVGETVYEIVSDISGSVEPVPGLEGYVLIAAAQDGAGIFALVRDASGVMHEATIAVGGASTVPAAFPPDLPQAGALHRIGGRWVLVIGKLLYTRSTSLPDWSASSAYTRFPQDFGEASGWLALASSSRRLSGGVLCVTWRLQRYAGIPARLLTWYAAVVTADGVTWTEVLSPTQVPATGFGSAPAANECADWFEFVDETTIPATRRQLAIVCNAAGTAWAAVQCQMLGEVMEAPLVRPLPLSDGTYVAGLSAQYHDWPLPSLPDDPKEAAVVSTNGVLWSIVSDADLRPAASPEGSVFPLRRSVLVTSGPEVLIDVRTSPGWTVTSSTTIPAGATEAQILGLLRADVIAAAEGKGLQVAIDSGRLVIRGPAGVQLTIGGNLSAAETVPQPVSLTVLADAPATAFTAVGAATGLTTIGSAVVQNPR